MQKVYDELDEQIAKARAERLKDDKTKATFGGAGEFDKDIYGGGDKFDGFEAYLPVGEEEEGEDDALGKLQKARMVNTYTAPQAFLDEVMRGDDKYDPFEERQKEQPVVSRVIADKEDEYRAQWRKRRLSPPQKDAFRGGGGERSYVDIMREQELEKEHRLVLAQIQRKEEDRTKNQQEVCLKLILQAKRLRFTATRQDGTQRRGWFLFTFKKGQKLGEPIKLKKKREMLLGRNKEAEVLLEHPSCSKVHAKIVFLSAKDSRGEKQLVPHIIDNESTNKTKLNGREIKPQRPYDLRDDDVLTFGASLREYRVKFQP